MGLFDAIRKWRGGGILNETLDAFLGMIEDTHWMYRQAVSILWDDCCTEDMTAALYKRDISVNEAERENRKKIVQHLAIHPKGDVNYCLVLMSVMKDAERLGDYCKNLLEITAYYDMKKDDNEFVTAFKDIHAELELMFRRTVKSFRESDEKLGAQLVRKEVELSRACDRMIDRVVEAKSVIVPQAVSYALLSRHCKRIAAHLGNIASAVVMPLHKLDYFDEKHLPDSVTREEGRRQAESASEE